MSHERGLAERELTLPPTAAVTFGAGSSAGIGEVVRTAVPSARHIVVVTDRGVRRAGVTEQVVEPLTSAGLATEVLDDVEPNPRVATVAKGVALARQAADTVVVAVGGGSVMDAAKAVALAATNERPIDALGDGEQSLAAGLPVIAVPTTAGTGSETNGFGVLTRDDRGAKVYVGHDSVRPRAAVLDPALTLGVPPQVTAHTGMDAFTHALEAVSSCRPNPYADGLAGYAIGAIGTWLPRAVADGSDPEARAQLLLASHLAGLAFASGTGLGLCHALAHPISSRLGAPHGLALCAVLPEVMRFNAPVCAPAYALVARSLGVADPTTPVDVATRRAIRAVTELIAAVGAAVSVRELGVDEAVRAQIVADALADPVLGGTARQPAPEDLEALLSSRA